MIRDPPDVAKVLILSTKSRTSARTRKGTTRFHSSAESQTTASLAGRRGPQPHKRSQRAVVSTVQSDVAEEPQAFDYGTRNSIRTTSPGV